MASWLRSSISFHSRSIMHASALPKTSSVDSFRSLKGRPMSEVSDKSSSWPAPKSLSPRVLTRMDDSWPLCGDVCCWTVFDGLEDGGFSMELNCCCQFILSLLCLCSCSNICLYASWVLAFASCSWLSSFILSPLNSLRGTGSPPASGVVVVVEVGGGAYGVRGLRFEFLAREDNAGGATAVVALVASSSMAGLLRTGTEGDDGEGPLTERGRAAILLSGSSAAGGRILPAIQLNRDIADGVRGVAAAPKWKS